MDYLERTGMTLEEFRQLPIYKFAVEKGKIVDDEWVGWAWQIIKALRFALYENLFADKPVFIILDDCLVNLDPERTKKAIKLIKNFQDKYQIIFSTCDPETARRLGGNVINL